MKFKRIRLTVALLGAVGMFGALVTPMASNAGVVDGVKNADGLMIYLGVVPAATVRGHAKDHPEAKMHGGAPSSSHSMHIVAAVFESDTGKRITGAKVRAHITEPGGFQRTIRLEPMSVADALTYGGFATFQRGITYQIGIEVDRSATKRGAAGSRRTHPATAHFTYTHD